MDMNSNNIDCNLSNARSLKQCSFSLRKGLKHQGTNNQAKRHYGIEGA